MNKFTIICRHALIRLGLSILIAIAVVGEEIPWDAVEASAWSFELAGPPDSAIGGAAIAGLIQNLDLEQREIAINAEIARGNIPNFLRTSVPIQFSQDIGDMNFAVTFYVMPDYLALGTDADYFLMPMTPILAQGILDRIGGVFPTRKMVNLIWEAAELKLEPAPIEPSAAMVTMVVFAQHNKIVHYYRDTFLDAFPLGALVSGHKKDVILSNSISKNPNKVVIYGWHQTNAEIIQPLFSGHVNWYADYSHGIRPVLARCMVNDSIMDIREVLNDPLLYQLLSDESGPMEVTRYDTSSSYYPQN
ncbi:hypothetical protein HQ531_10450 [bacterium]|nr:hypothetical protein [bacterium]